MYYMSMYHYALCIKYQINDVFFDSQHNFSLIFGLKLWIKKTAKQIMYLLRVKTDPNA